MRKKRNRAAAAAMTSLNEIKQASSDSADAQEECPLPPLHPPDTQRSSDTTEPDSDSLVVENADMAIKRGGEKFYDYYVTYKNLRELAKPMHGKPASSPVPQPIVIKKITIEYSNGNADDIKSVAIPEPQKIGEIAPLLSFAMRDIIEKMNNELHVLSYLVSGMHKSVQSVFNARVMAPPKDLEDNTNTAQ